MTEPDFDDAFRAKLAQLFTWRRDVRHFRSDPIPVQTIARLTSEASHSPSVGYSQPWRFVNVVSEHRRSAVISSFERANADALRGYDGADATKYATLKLAGLREAPVHLAVFCDDATDRGKGLGRATMPETLAYSVVMSIYTFWLAARACGIGAGWVSILEPGVVTTALDVSGSWQLVAYLCVGYPRAQSDSPELERASWEKRDDRAATLYER